MGYVNKKGGRQFYNTFNVALHVAVKFLRVLSFGSPNFLLGYANRLVIEMGLPSPHPQLRNLGARQMPPAKISQLHISRATAGIYTFKTIVARAEATPALASAKVTGKMFYT